MPVLATVSKPETGENAPYYDRYIGLVSGTNILEILETQIDQTAALLSRSSEEQGNYRYAPDKWSLKQVVGHLSDSERVFAYRALRIARGDATPLAGFEQDDYVRHGPFQNCRLADLVNEFRSVRLVTLSLFRPLDAAAWTRRGTANNSPISVRALAYITAGHELHHRKILLEKYLVEG